MREQLSLIGTTSALLLMAACSRTPSPPEPQAPLIRDMPRASRASNIADLATNPDGSVDLCFGPEAPKGKEANWIPTDPKRCFELTFRAYGPTKQFMDKAWKLSDLVTA